MIEFIVIIWAAILLAAVAIAGILRLVPPKK